MKKYWPEQERWLPSGFESPLNAIDDLREKRANSVLTSEEAKNLDRLIRDKALWHRLFGDGVPLQGLASLYASPFPPGWHSWEPPSAPYSRHEFDTHIEQALSKRGRQWREDLEFSGVRCLYLEVRAEIRRWLLEFEFAHGGYTQRNEIADKLKTLLDSSTEVLDSIGKMREAVSLLSGLEMPDGYKNLDPFTKYYELYDEVIFESRFSELKQYLVSLEFPTKRYLDYYSPKGTRSTLRKRRGRKKGTGVNVRRRLLGINAIALFALLKGAYPGEDNTVFQNFLSDLENLIFNDEDTEAMLPTEVPPVNRKDIRRLSNDTVLLLKNLSGEKLMQLVPKNFDDLEVSKRAVREIFEDQVWNSWEETALRSWPYPSKDTRDPT